MSREFARPLNARLQPSATLTRINSVAHLIAIGISLSLPMPWYARVAVMAAIAVSWYWAHKKRNPGPVAEIQAKSPDHWRIKTRNGQQRNVRLLPHSTAWDKLIVLQFQAPDERFRRYSAVIFPDSLSANDWHRLRRSLNYRP